MIAVDLNTGFNAATSLRDEFHPNVLGENKIAQKWFAALAQVLPAPNPAPATVTWLSGLTPTSSVNGLGPVELNFSNGEAGALRRRGDRAQRRDDNPRDRCRGRDALVYSLAGKYTSFRAEVGVDDEVGPAGTVVFQVFVDNVKKFDSGVMTGAARPSRSASI